MHYAGVLQLQCTQGPSLVPEQLDSTPNVSRNTIQHMFMQNLGGTAIAVYYNQRHP